MGSGGAAMIRSTEMESRGSGIAASYARGDRPTRRSPRPCPAGCPFGSVPAEWVLAESGQMRPDWAGFNGQASAGESHNERFLVSGLDSFDAVVGTDPGDGLARRMAAQDGEAGQGRSRPPVTTESVARVLAVSTGGRSAAFAIAVGVSSITTVRFAAFSAFAASPTLTLRNP